jgi:hypothetical protein
MTTIRINDSTAHELKELCFRTDSYEKVIAMLIGSFKRYDPRWEAIQNLKAAVENNEVKND